MFDNTINLLNGILNDFTDTNKEIKCQQEQICVLQDRVNYLEAENSRHLTTIQKIRDILINDSFS